MEAKAKVKDIAISRERVTLRDVLHEGTCLTCSVFPLSFFSVSLKHQRRSQNSVLQKGLNIISRISLKSGTHIQSVCSWLSKNGADYSGYNFFPSLCSCVLLCIWEWSSSTSWCTRGRAVCSGLIQKPQIIKKDFLKNANTEGMQTNEQSNKTLICW